MLTKPLNELDHEDVEHFVSVTRLHESAFLDYKRDYDLTNSKSKKGFLKAICALANHGGGFLFIGVDEETIDKQKTGYPASPPCGAPRFDKTRAEDTLHTSIEPKVGPHVTITQFQGGWENGPVYVIKVEHTGSMPHCVISGEQPHRIFYKRSGPKSEPMDINQIRSAFIGSSSLLSDIKDFHSSRIAKVSDGQLMFPVTHSSGYVLTHVIPIRAFALRETISLDSVPFALQTPEGGSSYGTIHNFDGKIAYSKSSQDDSLHSYIQVFRNGTIESVDTGFVHNNKDINRQTLDALGIEGSILRSLEQASLTLQSLGQLDSPCAVHISAWGVQGCIIYRGPQYSKHGIHHIEHDRLNFPHLRIDSLEVDNSQALRPLFDLLWQSSGYAKSPSFDPRSGLYTPQWH